MAKLTNDQQKHLEQLIDIADSTLATAKEARENVINYLNEVLTPEPERSDYEAVDWLENECEWCYGIDRSLVDELIINNL